MVSDAPGLKDTQRCREEDICAESCGGGMGGIGEGEDAHTHAVSRPPTAAGRRGDDD